MIKINSFLDLGCSSVAVRVTLKFHPNVNLMPSHHPAKVSIWKTEIKSLANSKLQAKAPMLALTEALLL
jgi:hypothetical protein